MVALIMLAIAAIFQLYWSFLPVSFLVDMVFERDDAFYYIKIARNMAETGQASFDGIHLSNGVQLMWHYMLTGLAFVVEDKILYLRAVLLLCVACNLLVGWLLWLLGRQMLNAPLGAIMVILWSGIMIERWHTLQGMEYSLHLAIALICLLLLWRVVVERDMARPVLFWLGLALAACFWSRLDAVVFAVAIWAVVAGLIWSRMDFAPRMGALIALTVMPAIGAVAYVASSYSLAETWLPLSGGVKSYYAQRFFEGVGPARIAIEQVGWAMKIHMMLVLSLVPANLYDMGHAVVMNPLSQPEQLVIPVVAKLVSLLGVWRIWRHYGFASAHGRVFLLAIALFVVCTVHIGVAIWALGDFSHVTRHYYGWLLIFWLIWGGLLLVMLLEALPEMIARGLAVALLAGFVVAYGLMGYRFAAAYDPRGLYSHAFIRMGLSETLNKTLPEDATVGAWNAGALGFFLERPVVNLDGLVNDKAYLEVLESGTPVLEYIKAEGITHLIDHNGRDLTLAYQETRDLEGEFRNGITWEDVEVLDKVEDIYVLAVR